MLRCCIVTVMPPVEAPRYRVPSAIR